MWWTQWTTRKETGRKQSTHMHARFSAEWLSCCPVVNAHFMFMSTHGCTRSASVLQVCYSWWVLSALSILNAISWIDGQALVSYILECQDSEAGGISDRPQNMADVFHTYF